MGIVNLTGDSFWEGSRMMRGDGEVDVEGVVRRVGQMIDDGADIIDLGACSTRPGSEGVGVEEEWRRLSSALSEIKRHFPQAKISIDTYWSEIVRRAYELIGEFIVNDISAGKMDDRMLGVVGRIGLPYIAMHMKGTPKDMQQRTDYLRGVMADEIEYFTEFARKAEENSIRQWCLDPGFGFSKTIEQNYELLRGLPQLKRFDRPILVGVSRKSMIYRPLGLTPETSLTATQVVQYEALRQGADILRVHDILPARHTIELFRL